VWFVGGMGWDVGNGVCSCWFELREFWFVGRCGVSDGRNVLGWVGEEVVVVW